MAVLERHKRAKARYWRKLKAEVHAAYGDGTCAECGADGPLELDHVEGGGRQHRMEVTGYVSNAQKFYRWLRQHGFPNNPPLQTLCTPCHREKSNKELSQSMISQWGSDG